MLETSDQNRESGIKNPGARIQSPASRPSARAGECGGGVWALGSAAGLLETGAALRLGGGGVPAAGVDVRVVAADGLAGWGVAHVHGGAALAGAAAHACVVGVSADRELVALHLGGAARA